MQSGISPIPRRRPCAHFSPPSATEPSPLTLPPPRQADASHLSVSSVSHTTQGHAQTHGWQWLLSAPPPPHQAPFASCKSDTFLFLCADGRGFPTEKPLLPVNWRLLWDGQLIVRRRTIWGNGYGRNGHTTTVQTPTPSFLPGSGIWLPSVSLSTSAFSLDKHPLAPQLPSALPGFTRPDLPQSCLFAPWPQEVKRGPLTTSSTCNHVLTFLGCLKSCPSLLQVYADRPVSRDESMFIVKASLRKQSETQTRRRQLQGRAAR